MTSNQAHCASGRVTEVNFPSTLSETYTYDSIYQLTQVVQNGRSYPPNPW